jgi:hypothetical protein
MRRLSLSLAVLGCLTTSSIALAMTAPMSEEEMLEVAVLVVEGAITAVECNGTPQVANGATMTSYLATLTIETAIKPEESELETVTLPFGKIEYDEDTMPPSCAWSPSYSVGERGTYYLETGSSTDYYTLVHYSGFIEGEDSVGVALPSCEEGADPEPEPDPEPDPEPEPDVEAFDDTMSTDEDATEVGPEADATDPVMPTDVDEPGPSDTESPDEDDAVDPAMSDTTSAAPEEEEPETEPSEEEESDSEAGESEDEGGCAGGPSSLPSGLMLMAGLMLVLRRRLALD